MADLQPLQCQRNATLMRAAKTSKSNDAFRQHAQITDRNQTSGFAFGRVPDDATVHAIAWSSVVRHDRVQSQRAQWRQNRSRDRVPVSN